MIAAAVVNGYPRAKGDRSQPKKPSDFFPTLKIKPVRQSGTEIVRGFKDRFRH